MWEELVRRVLPFARNRRAIRLHVCVPEQRTYLQTIDQDMREKMQRRFRMCAIWILWKVLVPQVRVEAGFLPSGYHVAASWLWVCVHEHQTYLHTIEPDMRVQQRFRMWAFWILWWGEVFVPQVQGKRTIGFLPYRYYVAASWLWMWVPENQPYLHTINQDMPFYRIYEQKMQ